MNNYQSPNPVGQVSTEINSTASIPVRLEYVWLDGHNPKNLRSKVRYDEWSLDSENGNMDREEVLSRIEEWNFDGSSTNQAKTKNSDVVLHPVKVYHNSLEVGEIASFIVLCETFNTDGTPHKTNSRYDLRELVDDKIETSDDMWFSVEQEYTFVDEDDLPVKWNHDNKQGQNYCGVGSQNTNCRFVVEQHAKFCIDAGIGIAGTNAEVLLSQWEYQLTPKGALETADDLWISRYILHRLTEELNFSASFHPKPIDGEWNGAGAHINFSTEYMRENSDKEYIENVCKALGNSHTDTMQYYGEDNRKRLTGDCETQHYSKFTYGVGDRGASVRIPSQTAIDWSGYLEDRRPAANMDPYDAFSILIESVSEIEVPETIEM